MSTSVMLTVSPVDEIVAVNVCPSNEVGSEGNVALKSPVESAVEDV